jgi:sarcosine oxidase, subunit beta
MASQLSADVVIVGAGIRGLIIEYYLSKHDVSVCILEKRFICAGASGLNTGFINVSDKGPRHYTELSKTSADLYPELNEELGGGFEYKRNGFISLVQTQEEWVRRESIIRERNQIPGLGIQILSIGELRQLEPALSPQILGGSYCAIDGSLNPLKFAAKLVQQLRARQVKIIQEQEVRTIETTGRRITAVVTNRLRVSTNTVINAAGIDVPKLSRQLNVCSPVFAEKGQVAITEPLPRVLNRVVDPYKQFDHGEVFIGVTHERVGEDLSVSVEKLSQISRVALRVLPVLGNANIIRCAAALRPIPPDRLPIYERVDEIEHYYVAVGHSGITLAPVTGRIFSDLILRGETDVPLVPYAARRFKPEGITTQARGHVS